MNSTVRLAILIPAYRPEQALLDVIASLSAGETPAIVLVDDGSGADYEEIFRRAAAFEKVHLVRHAVNIGKGAALKTGFNYALCTFPDLVGVVTADADGQHHPEDIEKVAAALAAEPDRLILGSRTFNGDVPLRSLVGNLATRTVMRALVGQRVSDTQTGLRGIPAALMRRMLRAESNGYDFELDMLIAVRQQAIEISEVPIRTIYEAGNRTSHFNPLIDSMKIYFVLLRFSSVSVMSAALDTLVFYLAYRRLGNLAASQILGRVVAVAFNYLMVRRAVFFSRLRHASVLPKYLLLVCTSLTVSYAGIELLSTRFHIGALPAKLLVESLLFFANFAIQRDFIFGRTPGDNGKNGGHEVTDVARTLLQTLLAVAAAVMIGVVWTGFRGGTLPVGGGWTPPGWQRLLVYSVAFWGVSAAILLIAPRVYAAVAALTAAATMAVALGPAAVLVVVFFLLSACALGSRLLGNEDPGPEAPLYGTMLGIAVYVFAMTLVVRLPINYTAVYLALMAAPVAADLRGTGRRLRNWGKALTGFRPSSWSHGAGFALLVYVLGMHLLIIPKPESSSDGLAMHLAIPVNVSVHHAFTYRPDRILWSVMPMGADWCYTLVFLPAGEFAARLLNFALMAILVTMLYRMARRYLPPAGAYLIAAVFASASVVQLITGSMFIENFLAAMVAGAVLAIIRFGETGRRRLLYTAAVLAGTGMAIKFGGVVYVAAIVPVAAVEIRRQWRRLGPKPAMACAVAVALLLAAAAPTYAIAWKLTRNPLFPFLNRTFPSPVLDRDVNIADYRFTQPLTAHTPYDVTFHSERYLEGRPGSIGFAYLLLAPLGLLALAAVKDKAARSAAAVSLMGALIVLAFLPNVRYLYPSLPLLLVPVAGLFGWLQPGVPRRILGGLAITCVALNVWFLPSSNFYHGDFFERSPFSRAMRKQYIRRTAPMREIGDYMNRTHPGAAVFLANGADLAAFNAEVYANGWHQYNVFARLSLAQSAHEVLDLFRGWHIQYVAAGRAESGMKVEPEPLRVLVTQCATPEYQTPGYYVVRLADRCDIAAPTEREPALVTAGQYDDADGAIAYRGRWSQNPGFADTFRHTISYSNLPGSDVRIAFEGVALTVIYTQAPNRAMAAVTIDGVEQAVLDEYAREIHWQSRAQYGGLKPGRHLATITVLARRNPAAKDGFVDVDGFEVQGPVQSSLGPGEWPVYSVWLALTVILIYLARAWPGISPETAVYAGAGAALFCWFLYTVRGGLSSWFDADDLMNIYYCWSRPWTALLKANVFFWSSYYRPGGGLFYRVIYSIWGFQPFPFRMATYVLLAADFGLLAVVVRKLTGSRWCVLLALILLGTHPMFSAAYVDTGTIYDVLAYLFYWSAFVLYVQVREKGRVPGGWRLALLVCLFVAALNSKEVSVTLPVAIGLYELIWHRPGVWTVRGLWRWARQEGRFAAIGAVCDVAYLAGKRYGPDSLWKQDAYHPRYSLQNYFDSLSHYLHDELVYHTVSLYGDLAVLLVVMALVAAATRRPALLWGLAFILTGILPLAFIPGRGGFAYLVPSVGWAVYLGDLFNWLISKAAGNRVRVRSIVQAALLVVLFVKLSPWERKWIGMHTEAAHLMQGRFARYRDQIQALIPRPREGAKILLLNDAEGYEDWDVFFLIRLNYGDPKMDVERLPFNKTVGKDTNPAAFDYVLDWVDGRFVLAGRS